jgi:leucyl-tRNA synthetase
MSYGTGAVMSVPAHDQRDFEFARKYSIPIVGVIKPAGGDVPDLSDAAFTDHGVCYNSGQFDGMDFDQAFEAIAGHLEAHANGERRVNFRLRDWGVSRQRYWGCPIPMIHDENGKEYPVSAGDLPVRLPEDVEFDGSGSPLKSMPEFRQVKTAAGQVHERETDTFDTFFESSWYYARYCCPDNDQAMLDERANYWLPVDQYVGGIEHAVMHLLYARFFHKLMRDEGLVSSDEPFTNLLTQGMVVAETYYRENAQGQKTWFSPAEVDVERDGKGHITAARLLADGEPVTVGSIEKMSKSKNNGVDPQALIDQYGADTVRLYIMFASPPDQSLEWSDSAVEGAFRFLKRLWKLAVTARDCHTGLDADALSPEQKEIRYRIHSTINKVNDDIGRRYTFNTAIAAVMELVNVLARMETDTANDQAVFHEGISCCVLLLAPIVPHICEAIWTGLGNRDAVIDHPWPRADASALLRDEIDLVVQVNGKLRGRITVATDADTETIQTLAQADENVQRFTSGKTVRKIIVVPGRLVNIVVS